MEPAAEKASLRFVAPGEPSCPEGDEGAQNLRNIGARALRVT